jgi:hypothetical protein
MSIVIYYHKLDPAGDRWPQAEYLGMDEMSKALDRMQHLRTIGATHVCMSVDNPFSVGKPGVDSISADGMCPDGVPYDWKKRRL